MKINYYELFNPTNNGCLQKIKISTILLGLKIRNYIKYHALLVSGARSVANLRGNGDCRNALIVANGPSVGMLDIERLDAQRKKNKIDIFCMNNYLVGNLADKIKPDYYVLTDPTYFGIRENWQLQYDDQIRDEKFVIDELIRLQIPTLIPIEFKNHADGINQIYFNGFSHPNFKNIDNPLLPIGVYPLSAMRALAICVYMGYGTISIIGYDHSNFKNINLNISNEISEGSDHFYHNKSEIIKYPKEVYKNISSYFKEYSRIFEVYYKFSKYKIYNLNLNGFIDAFEKKDIFRILK
jgi:hypothetical protein